MKYLMEQAVAVQPVPSKSVVQCSAMPPFVTPPTFSERSFSQMQKEILLHVLEQNRFTTHFSLDRVSQENATLRLNDGTASIGFIYRHIGETMHLFGQFFAIPTDVVNSTMGQTDHGQMFDVECSRQLIATGYEMLKSLLENSADEDWLKPVDTPFFGTVPRIRLLAHVLFHNSHHAGQISLTLAKGSRQPQNPQT